MLLPTKLSPLGVLRNIIVAGARIAPITNIDSGRAVGVIGFGRCTVVHLVCRHGFLIPYTFPCYKPHGGRLQVHARSAARQREAGKVVSAVSAGWVGKLTRLGPRWTGAAKWYRQTWSLLGFAERLPRLARYTHLMKSYHAFKNIVLLGCSSIFLHLILNLFELLFLDFLFTTSTSVIIKNKFR